MRQQPRPVGQVMSVGMRAGVGVGHGGDDCWLYHPLQVLAGCDCIDRGDEGTVGARHVNPVLLQREGRREENSSEEARVGSCTWMNHDVHFNPLSILFLCPLTPQKQCRLHQYPPNITHFSYLKLYSNDSIEDGNPWSGTVILVNHVGKPKVSSSSHLTTQSSRQTESLPVWTGNISVCVQILNLIKLFFFFLNEITTSLCGNVNN